MIQDDREPMDDPDYRELRYDPDDREPGDDPDDGELRYDPR